MKLTKSNVKQMLSGQTLTCVCTDAAEYVSCYQTAQKASRELRAEGTDRQISISGSAKTLTVVIRVT